MSTLAMPPQQITVLAANKHFPRESPPSQILAKKEYTRQNTWITAPPAYSNDPS